jgi:hypothetical protein
MRCHDVIESLSTPPVPASAEIAAAVDAHLASCPHCAAWARRDARLSRLWEATQPEEPSPAAWSTLWSQVASTLEATSVTPSILSASSLKIAPSAGTPTWRRWTWGALAVAQAAVILLAAWLVSRPEVVGPPQPPGAPSGAPLVRKPAKVDIDYGSLALIHLDGPEVKVDSYSADEGTGSVDSLLVGYGFLEALGE